MKAAAPSVSSNSEPMAACIAYYTGDSEGQAGYLEGRQGMKGHMGMGPHEDRGRTEVISGCTAFCVCIWLSAECTHGVPAQSAHSSKQYSMKRRSPCLLAFLEPRSTMRSRLGGQAVSHAQHMHGAADHTAQPGWPPPY